MNDRPVTVIVRVWQRPEGFRAEVRSLQGTWRQTFRQSEDLKHFLETLENWEGLEAKTDPD